MRTTAVRREWVGMGTTVLIWWTALVLTLPDYGATWDEPGWFAIGDITLEYLRTGDPARIVHEKAYGRLTAVLSSLSHAVFAKRLGWLDPIPARHLPYTVMAASAMLACMALTRDLFGRRAAVAAGVFMACFPRLFADAHNNPLDISAMAFFTATVWAYRRSMHAVERRERRWRVAAMVFLGLLWSSRSPSAYYLLATLGIWRWWPWRGRLRRGEERRPSLGREMAENLVVFLLTAKISNPLMWSSSVFYHFLLTPLSFLADAGRGVVPQFFGGRLYEPGQTPRFYAPAMLVLTMPLGMGAAFAAGWMRRGRDAALGRSGDALLMVLIVAVGLGKHFGGAGNYDGIRHFWEIYPVLFAGMGLGAAWIGERLAPSRADWASAVVALALCLGPLAAIIRLHPYQQIYFNTLGGTPSEADARFELDYWGQSLREAMDWVRVHRSEVTLLYAPIEAPLLGLYAPPGMEVMAMPSLAEARRRPDAAVVVFFRRRGFYRGYGPGDSLAAWCEAHRTPIHRVVRNGAVLASVYDWSSADE